MQTNAINKLDDVLRDNKKKIIESWMKSQLSASTLWADLLSEKELQQKSEEFLKLLICVLNQNQEEMLSLETPEYSSIIDFLNILSSNWALMGFSPAETATFVFSLKQPIFDILSSLSQDAQALSKDLWFITALLDKLGLYTVEAHQKTREQVIKQQQQELLELSTPVTQLWEGILMLPLIGTLDSARTQLVMENLLQKIVDTRSTVAIIDITGIPLVDTLVAQHLIKTMNAARLMGAECIISGIRPQIAQTIVHLGISLTDVTTKATLADAVGLAMKKAGFTVASALSH